MKKNFIFTSLILTMALLCSGCGHSTTSETTIDTAFVNTSEQETENLDTPSTETIEIPASETVVVDTFEETEEIITEAFNPVTGITDTMWVAYEYTFNNGYPMYLINFHSDGTMEYCTGWVKSEIAFLGEGTWTSSGDQITYNITGDGYSFSGTLEFVLVAGDNLVLSHVSGDALVYLMESGPMEFVVQGSSMDNPPI